MLKGSLEQPGREDWGYCFFWGIGKENALKLAWQGTGREYSKARNRGGEKGMNYVEKSGREGAEKLRISSFGPVSEH